MATVRDVKKLVKPLLERHDDLELVGRWIFVKPIRHVARGIRIDGVGYPNGFRPCWAVSHLCNINMAMNLAWGEAIYHPTMNLLWYFNDPTAIQILIEIVEKQTLPLLRSINTLDDFVAVANGPHSESKLEYLIPCRVTVDIARGDFESARKLESALFSDRWRSDHPDGVMRRLWPLLEANDRVGMAKALHEREAAEVKRLKIEKIWEPTPFPLELRDETSTKE